MGAVTDVVRRYVPSSYKAMIEATQTSDYYGATELQAVADYVKFKLLGSAVAEATEAASYDILLTNFLGKLTTIQFIPAAVDFWGDQLQNEVTHGTNETISYPERRDQLWKIFDDLRAQVQAEFDELAEDYGFVIRGSGTMLPQVSYGDNGRGVLVTEDPQEFGIAFPAPALRTSSRQAGLIWSKWE
jgi:hypothetical protein